MQRVRSESSCFVGAPRYEHGLLIMPGKNLIGKMNVACALENPTWTTWGASLAGAAEQVGGRRGRRRMRRRRRGQEKGRRRRNRGNRAGARGGCNRAAARRGARHWQVPEHESESRLMDSTCRLYESIGCGLPRLLGTSEGWRSCHGWEKAHV